MNEGRVRQRLRKVILRILGTGSQVEYETAEQSAFSPNGDILSGETQTIPILQGVAAHDPEAIAGQCLSCFSFTTELVLCESCWQQVCKPCASRRSNMVVCPACSEYLRRRRRFLILRKLVIDPFIERTG